VHVIGSREWGRKRGEADKFLTFKVSHVGVNFFPYKLERLRKRKAGRREGEEGRDGGRKREGEGGREACTRKTDRYTDLMDKLFRHHWMELK